MGVRVSMSLVMTGDYPEEDWKTAVADMKSVKADLEAGRMSIGEILADVADVLGDERRPVEAHLTLTTTADDGSEAQAVIVLRDDRVVAG